MKQTAVKAYLAVCCEGMARVDFFIDRKTGELFLNEINTIPGFTSISMFPRMCEASGLKYPDLIDRVIQFGFERHSIMQSLSYKL